MIRIEQVIILTWNNLSILVRMSVRYQMWENSSFENPNFLPDQESVILIMDLLTGYVILSGRIGETRLLTFPPINQFRDRKVCQ